MRIGLVSTRFTVIYKAYCIRLADFQNIAAAGINTVRIPVGTIGNYPLPFNRRILVVFLGPGRSIYPGICAIS